MTKIPSVEETSRHFCNGIALQLEPSNAVMEAIRLLNKELPKALQAQRDAGAREERENWKSVLDADSCECDNCHRTRRYLKNPAKELHKVKQALTPPTK